jgi:hypothetical protein
MPRNFHPATNALARGTAVGVPLLVLVLVCAGYAWQRSPYVSNQEVVIEQPVPFSHKHHVNGLGIDCRYCHTQTETSQFAGVPPTKTCMSCHSQLYNGSDMLKPVRESWATNKPIQWSAVHKVPHYVLFPHDIHVNKGVGCSTCHGAVHDMPLVWQNASLQMQWCLNCHRNPEQYLRPREEVFNTYYVPPPDQAALGARLAKLYNIRPRQKLESCSTCHY